MYCYEGAMGAWTIDQTRSLFTGYLALMIASNSACVMYFGT